MAPRRSDSPEEDEDAMSVSSHHQNESDDSSDESETVQDHPIPDKDSDEDELERFVLGDTNTFREQLHKADYDESGLVTEEDGQGHEDLDDAQLFYFDAPAAAPKDLEASASTAVAALPVDPKDAPAWEDSDDERLTVSLATATQLRKLRAAVDEDVIDGVEFTRRARQQYLRLNPYPDWAKAAEERPAKRRRRSSAASDDSDASISGASDEDDGLSAMPLDKFLRDANATRRGQPERPRKLRPEVIDIQRSRDIPDRHRDPVTSLSFHPKYPVLMSSSTDSLLYLHRIDATAQPTPHPMLTSVQVKQVPIRHAEFLQPAGDTIFFAGRRRFIHSWNLPTGLIQRTDKIQGHHLEQRTWERFKLSPCGRYLGIISTSRKGGSYVQVLSVTTMQWIAAARLDSRGGIITFQWWSTGNGMTILGKGGQVGEWSMASRRFVAIWHDEGSTGGTAMALGGHAGPALLGGDKWIAIGSNSGVVNIYDRDALILPSGDDELNVKERPEPAKTFMQLTVPVTTILFSPDGQLACFASVHKKDALRLVHTGSLSVYRNWPTEQTPLGRITSVAFSKDMQLAVGNDAGAVRLWEIRG